MPFDPFGSDDFRRLNPSEFPPDAKAEQLKALVAVAKTMLTTKVSGPNKTELEATSILRLIPESLVFEGRTFSVVGHSYTPDWYGSNIAIEVKAQFIYSRDSRILFDAARLAHPELTWIWARKRTKGKKGKRWDVEIYPKKC